MYNVYLLDIATLQAFNNELSTLESWLKKSSLFLEDLFNGDVTDNVGETEQKLKQIRSFYQDVDKIKSQIEIFRTSANGILEKSEPNFASLLNNKLEVVTYKWTAIIDQAKSLSDKYEGALKKNDDVSTYTQFS